MSWKMAGGKRRMAEQVTGNFLPNNNYWASLRKEQQMQKLKTT